MKKTTRLIAIITMIAMLVISFAACSDNDKDDDKDDRKEKIEKVEKRERKSQIADDRKYNDGKEFTYWTIMDNISAVAQLESYDDMLMFRALEKETGVHIKFRHPVVGASGAEAFTTMMYSKNRAELVEYNWTAYTGGPQQAIDDGVIIALDDYLEEYAPNFYACVNGDENHFIFEEGLAKVENAKLWKLQATTEKGQFYGFNVLNIGTTRGFAGLYVRADLLKKWGLDVPKNIDDWTNVFAKAKAEGVQKPFTAETHVFDMTGSHSFNTAFDVGKGFYLEGNKVVFGPYQPGYKEYVAQMAEWTKAGYIDTTFESIDSDTIKSQIVNGISIASWGYIGGGLGTMIPAGQAINPEFDLVACPYPAQADGTPAEFQQVYPEASDKAIAITYNCGNYEKAAEWIDFRYSKEGSEINIFGVEGNTYTKAYDDELGRDVYTYTDKISKPEKAGRFGSVEEALYYYLLPCNHPGFNQHPDYLRSYYPIQAQKDALETWNESVAESTKHALNGVTFTKDELAEMADIRYMAEIPLNIAIYDIIKGYESIDTYDAAIEASKKHYNRYLEIEQAAYNRYLSKAK